MHDRVKRERPCAVATGSAGGYSCPVRHSSDYQTSPELRQLGRCWLTAALIILSTGPVLAVAGIGGSLWALAGFLVIFGVAVVPLILRELRPPISLVSSRHDRRPSSGTWSS